MKGSEIAEKVTPPPVPWKMRGRMHMALFRFAATKVPRLPAPLEPVWPEHRVVLLVRYLEGTLSYDEFGIGRLARLGATVSIFVDHLWVDSEPSVSGGRRYWGLPKELARFEWTGDRVQISDDEGEVAQARVDQRPTGLPAPPLPMSGFGVNDEGCVLLAASRLRLRVRRPSLVIERLAPRLGTITSERRGGFDAGHFDMEIGAARRVDSRTAAST